MSQVGTAALAAGLLGCGPKKPHRKPSRAVDHEQQQYQGPRIPPPHVSEPDSDTPKPVRPPPVPPHVIEPGPGPSKPDSRPPDPPPQVHPHQPVSPKERGDGRSYSAEPPTLIEPFDHLFPSGRRKR